MESPCELLFELSNEDRLSVLHELNENALKLTHLSKKLGITAQEAHRHLARMVDAKLVMKDSEGKYRPTSYCRLALKWIPGYTFISSYRDYFANHTLDKLPEVFLYRLGDLVNCVFTKHVMATFNDIEVMIQEAEEYIWLITDQLLTSNYSCLKSAIERNIQIKMIEQRDWISPPSSRERIREQQRETLLRARASGLFQSKLVDDIDVFLYVSEKAASFAFPALDGRFDYLGFTSNDEKSHSWCSELFQYYWEK